MEKVEIFDSTLRDGIQGEGIVFSLEDKLGIIQALDRLGVDWIEAGNPASNPKDMEFFMKAREMGGIHHKLVAFGSTCHRDKKPEDDQHCAALLSAQTDVVCIFGKSWDFQATQILQTTLEENLRMIRDTVHFFRDHGKEVFFDAEHYFDGYKANRAYALQCLEAAQEGGASRLILCDTNGGCFPDEISWITAQTKAHIQLPLGIHCHNDTGCAVANSIAAVEAGARQVQGTYIGFGERCGNANLSTIIPDLQLKMEYVCIPSENMVMLTKTARYIAEIANISLDKNMPFVGKSAFSHKGGMHVDGVAKNSGSFEHVSPNLVGNKRNVLLSEVSGRTAIINKIRGIDSSITKESPQAQHIVDILKELEYEGYQFESADASFKLIVLKELGLFQPYFELVMFRMVGEQTKDDEDDDNVSSAMVKVRVGDQFEITANEGNGPVHALDKALRKGLEVFYPQLSKVRLSDFKVRVIDPGAATAAKVRVLVESTDGEHVWSTVGVSTDIINASMQALVDSMEYKLAKDHMQKLKI